MKNKKIITAFLAITFSLLSLLTPLACVSAKMDQATTYQESNRKESHRKMSAPGTAVPNSGYVENIYFNTSLNVEEVVDILSELTYIQTPLFDNPLCAVLFSNDGAPIVFAGNMNNVCYFITIVTDMSNMEYVNAFDYENGTIEDGWKLNEYTINKQVISEYQGISIGTQNEAIKNLISITPFTESVSLIEAIGSGIANSAALFGAVLTNAFTAIASVFIANNELTLLGTVLVIAIGATVVSFAIKLILRLIQKIKV